MRRGLHSIALAMALHAFCVPSVMADMTFPIVPEIVLNENDGMLRIEGVVSSAQAQIATATMVVRHEGSGGSMNTSQSSNLDLAPGVRARVATAGINFGAGSKLVVDLSVMVDGRRVAHSRTVIGGLDHE